MDAENRTNSVCQPSERVKDDLQTSLQKFESFLEHQVVVMKGVVHENDSCDIVQQLLNHYETPRKQIDKSLRSFQSNSSFFAKPKQSADNRVYEEGDEAVPSRSSPERNPPVTLDDLQEDPETHSKYSHDTYELAEALENFRKFEREKAKESIKSNPNSSKFHQRLSKQSYNIGEKGGGSRRRINEAQSNYEKSQSGNRRNKMRKQSSVSSFHSEHSSASHTRRPRITRSRNSATKRKISIERRSVSKDRRTQSASELSRRHGEQAALPVDMSNSTWDLGTSASSLQKGRTGACKLHCPNGTSHCVSSVSSKSQFKQRDQERSKRAEQTTQRSWSLESMNSQKSTRRKPLRRIKSIDQSGLVISVRHVEPRQGAPELSSRNAKFPNQGPRKMPSLSRTKQQGATIMPSLSRAQSLTKQNGSTQMPTLSRTQSCPVPRNSLTPHGDNLGTRINGLNSANRPTITAQVVPGSYRVATPGSQHNIGGKDTPSTLKKRTKSFLLWQKAKNVSKLLPRQHL